MKPETYDRCRGKTEKIRHSEEQIFERVEEPDMNTRRFAAEVGVSSVCSV